MNTITLSLAKGIVRIVSVCGVTATPMATALRTDEPGSCSLIITTDSGNRIVSVLHGYHGHELNQTYGDYATGAVQSADIIEAAQAGGYNAVCALLWV